MLIEKIFDAKASNRVYATMVTTLYQELVDGKFTVGDRLPTEAQLRERFGISINSVRRGVELFVAEGILSRRRGSGMYVARIPTEVQTPVRRDTVAVLYETKLKTYHPYYSEMRKGIQDALDEKGWKVHLFAQSPGDPSWKPTVPDVYFPGMDLNHVRETIRTASHLAGVIAPLNMAQELSQICGTRVKLAVPGYSDIVPCVGYDWTDELAQATRLVLRRGAKTILVVGVMNADATNAIAQQAAACETRTEQPPRIIHAPIPGSAEPVFSKRMHDAYEKTLAALEAHPQIDGVVAASDFDAQGVLDAMAIHARSARREIPVAALVNKESRIHAQQAYAAVVADGYQVGVEVVNLLHEHITAPEHAPRKITLRGTVREN